MKKVTAILEMGSDGLFSCSVEEEVFGCGIAGYGNTADDAKSDMMACYHEMNEMLAEEGKECMDLEFDFRIDIQTFFSLFPFFSISRIADRAGINQSQLRQYARGLSQPSDMQYEKLSAAISEIKQELASVTF